VPAAQRGCVRCNRGSAGGVRGRGADQAFRRRDIADPARLAAALGDRVVVDSPVLTIDYTDDYVVVTCRGGLVAAGRQVIVALSPALAGRIMYDPPLPGVRDQLTQRMPLASAHKMFAIYDEPFWRLERVHGGAVEAGHRAAQQALEGI
jgi:monoamine oxidase